MRPRDRHRALALALAGAAHSLGCLLDAPLGGLDGEGDGSASDASTEDAPTGGASIPSTGEASTAEASTAEASTADASTSAPPGETTTTGDEPGGPGTSDGSSDADTSDSSIFQGMEPVANTGVVLDCTYTVTSWRAIEPSEPRLWVTGIYETRDDHGNNQHPVGIATIDWSIPGQNVLVVGAYEPTVWRITVAPGAGLQRVIATGYYAQAVEVPAGVEVDTYVWLAGDGAWTCGHSLPGDGSGCEGEDLVLFAMAVSGLPPYAFEGCYHATEFEFLP